MRRLAAWLLLALLASSAATAGEGAGPAVALAEARLSCARDEPGRRLEHLDAAARALEAAPAEGRVLEALARVRLAQNRPQDALAAAREAAHLLPDDARPRLDEGRALLRLWDPEAALEALHQAAERDPGRADGTALLRERARARLRSGDLEGAAEDARRALARETSSEESAALVRWCARRREAEAAAKESEPLEREAGARFLVRSRAGAEALDAATLRLGRLEEEAPSALGPLPAGRRRSLVHILPPEAYARVAPEGGGGARAFYQRDEGALFVCWEIPREAERLLAHEAVHALLHRLVEDAPAWLDEGLADALAVDPHPVRLRDAKVLLGAGKDVRFADFALRSRREMYAPDGLHLRFAGAWGAARYLRHEESKRLARIMEAVRAGASAPEVVARGFGDLSSLAEFDARWKAHVMGLPLEE